MATTKRAPGIYISVPTMSGHNDVAQFTSERMAYDDLLASDLYDDVVMAGQEVFVTLGYEDSDTIYATLYQINPSGGLDWSECLTIDGPEAE